MTFFLLFLMSSESGTAHFTVSTINVRGLNDPLQRRHIFQSLINSNFDSYCLQETHGKSDTINAWKKEWPGRSFWCPTNNPRSSGVAILLHPNCQAELVEEKYDEDGRIICLHLKIQKSYIQILNIYAPTKGSSRSYFFSNITNFIFQGIPLILAGDFNCVENTLNDRMGSFEPTHDIGMKEIKKITTNYGLSDSWRILNQSSRQFTWSNSNQTRQSRIDRIYIKRNWIHRSNIIPFPWSDHDIVATTLEIPKTAPKGKGVWKLNTSHLRDKEYLLKVRNFLRHWRTCKNQFPDIARWWDMGKHYIKGISSQYAIQKAKKSRERFLEADHALKQEQMQPQPDPHKMKFARDIIQQYEHDRNKGIFIRSKTQYYEEFEKPTKYFFNIQNANKQKSTIYELQKEHTTINNQQEILKECHDFYQDLYKKRPTCTNSQDYLLNNLDKELDASQRAKLDQPLTKEDLFKALTKMKPGKSPGIDGLPMEFYLVFWPEIKDDFFELVNHVHKNNIMSKTMREAILTLIFKKGEKKRLQNWRPISLLCVDYKIITAALANKLKYQLPHIISTDQTCSIPGRSILSNLRLMRDIIRYARDKSFEGVILSLDQKKAFDRVDHDFLDKVMQKMNIGPYFRTWVKTIYTNISCNISNNGYLSAPVHISRGVRQGCPLSALLYVILAETFGQAIRANPDIKGVKIPGSRRDVRISQYADDTTLFLTTHDSINKALIQIRIYEAATGARLNFDKTYAMRIGVLDWVKIDILDYPQINWVQNDGIKILGITFFNDYFQTQNYNWTTQIHKLDISLNQWKPRHLSLKGRALIINSIALSKLWYLGTIIKPLRKSLKSINKAIFDFLWNGQMCMISRDTCFLPLYKGGLGLLNPKRQIQALHLKAFAQIRNQECEELWVCLPRFWIGSFFRTRHEKWRFLSHDNTKPHTDLLTFL